MPARKWVTSIASFAIRSMIAGQVFVPTTASAALGDEQSATDASASPVPSGANQPTVDQGGVGGYDRVVQPLFGAVTGTRPNQ
jgi:hypothetical protein